MLGQLDDAACTRFEATDEQLFVTWAERQKLPLNLSTRAVFAALLREQLEDGWLN